MRDERKLIESFQMHRDIRKYSFVNKSVGRIFKYVHHTRRISSILSPHPAKIIYRSAIKNTRLIDQITPPPLNNAGDKENPRFPARQSPTLLDKTCTLPHRPPRVKGRKISPPSPAGVLSLFLFCRSSCLRT